MSPGQLLDCFQAWPWKRGRASGGQQWHGAHVLYLASGHSWVGTQDMGPSQKHGHATGHRAEPGQGGCPGPAFCRMKGQALAPFPLLGTQCGTPDAMPFLPTPQSGQCPQTETRTRRHLSQVVWRRTKDPDPGCLGPTGQLQAAQRNSTRTREEHHGLLSLCKAGRGFQMTFQS